jgi:hypothetical protein
MSTSVSQIGSQQITNVPSTPSFAAWRTDQLGNKVCVGIFETKAAAQNAADIAAAASANDGS